MERLNRIMAKLLLGIDIGTSACKVAVFEKSGKVIAQTNKPYKLYYPNPGWVEQDPDEWWNAIVDGIKEILKTVSADDIAGIGIDGQSWSAIPVDKDGNCLHNTPIWMDTRARDICERVVSEVGFDEIFELSNGLTLSEIKMEEKVKISPRKKALMMIKMYLDEKN